MALPFFLDNLGSEVLGLRVQGLVIFVLFVSSVEWVGLKRTH